MATLVNRDVIVRIEGCEVKCLCIGQSCADYWIKVRHPEGYDYMANSDDFVRVADSESTDISERNS